jgi:dTDP-4-amino-4,6-dideoxygalactose transaminase
MIRIVRPAVGEEEAEAIRHVLASGFLTQGEAVACFEASVASTAGVPHAIAVSSGTAALHLSLLALGIGPGDEVITSAFGFPATVNVIELVGARPVLVDIDLATYNLDVAQIEAAIGPRTKVILPVHEFGLMAEMEAISHIASRYSLRVIEDAACALGAGQYIEDQIVAAGSTGTVGCFSFHPRKSVTTAEGGCLATRDEVLARRLKALRSHGLETSDGGADVLTPGLNYRPTEIQGAIGVVQMRKLGWVLSERRRLAAAYDERLADLQWIHRPHEPKGWIHSYQSYVVLLPEGTDREALIHTLRQSGIEAVRGAYGVHRLKYYRDRYCYSPQALPAASAAHDRALALPLYPGMSERTIDIVAESLARAWH